MQAASHTKTEQNIEQIVNKPFESHGKINRDKNEARISSSLFLFYMVQGILLK